MRINYKLTIPLLFLGALLALFIRGLQLDPHKLPSALIDHPVPQFQLPLLSIQNQSLSDADLKGHVSLVHVFASWCTNCRDEQPVLLDIARRKLVPIYAIDYKDTIPGVHKFLADYGNPYTKIGLDQNGSTAINWGVYGTPETFVIDATGHIRYKHVGAMTAASWHDTILPLINKLKLEHEAA